MTRPGAPSRRPEIESLRMELEKHRPLAGIRSPATLDGGDVLQVGRRIRVGISSRSNAEGVRQLATILEPLGYDVQPLKIRGCLHLKTAVTLIGPDTILLNPAMAGPETFAGLNIVEVDPGEPMAANALLVGDTVIYPEAFPATLGRMEQAGVVVRTVPADELAKAEGGVSCCSIVLR